MWVIEQTVRGTIAHNGTVDIDLAVPFVLHILVHYLTIYDLEKFIFHEVPEAVVAIVVFLLNDLSEVL